MWDHSAILMLYACWRITVLIFSVREPEGSYKCVYRVHYFNIASAPAQALMCGEVVTEQFKVVVIGINIFKINKLLLLS
jgi:hypothetical protein